MSYFKPYKYVKDDSKDPMYKTFNPRFVFNSRFLPALILLCGGALFYSQIVLPIRYIKANKTDTPQVQGTVLGAAAGFSEFEFSELDAKSSHTSVPITPPSSQDQNVPEYFYLTIQKLGIEKAKVETNAVTLQPDKALGHYAKSALPGQAGNSFIYGHSVLPVFYNPKSYKSIFSTIDRLQVGDIIMISYNNNDYKYAVESKLIKKPIDVDPLAEFKPKYLNDSTLTLMTCTPPGSKIMRLMVQAVMIK
jgi:LPXTG-site transpeptidase (sortase) family protein